MPKYKDLDRSKVLSECSKDLLFDIILNTENSLSIAKEIIRKNEDIISNYDAIVSSLKLRLELKNAN